MRRWRIYTLSDPRTGHVRYVGWSFDPVDRLRRHISNCPKEKTHKGHWIKELVMLGLCPLMDVVQYGLSDTGWAQAERAWIARLRLISDLTNATDGGEGTVGFTPSMETREKMSRAHVGKRHSPESIEKFSSKLRGRKQSPEHIASLSRVRSGKAPMIATAAAAKAVRGKKQTAAQVAARVASTKATKVARSQQLKLF